MRPVLGGLPLLIELSSPLEIIRYLLLTCFFNVLAGAPAAREVARPNQFALVRAGWRRWWRRQLFRILGVNTLFGLAPLPLVFVMFPQFSRAELLWDWALWLPCMLACAALQTLLIGLLQNAQAGLVVMLLWQLCSVFCSVTMSSALVGNKMLLFIGNWGCYLRTREAGEPFGFQLPVGLGLSLLTVAVTVFFGWRIVRSRNRRE